MFVKKLLIYLFLFLQQTRLVHRKFMGTGQHGLLEELSGICILYSFNAECHDSIVICEVETLEAYESVRMLTTMSGARGSVVG
jgi:hypothetical protein